MPPSINASSSPTAITRKPQTTPGKGKYLPKREAAPTQKKSAQSKRQESTILKRQRKQGGVKGEECKTETSTELSTNTTPNNGDNLMTGMGTGGMYGGAGGYGMMSPYYNHSMMGMGMGMGMGGYGMGMVGGPFSGLNNFLFGVQNVIFSLGQAVQILGMNTHALQQLFQTAKSMIDHALSSINHMRLLDGTTSSSDLAKHQTEEEKKRKRRLKALRLSLVLSVSYTAYRVVHYLIKRNNRQRQNHRYLPSSTSSSYLQQKTHASNTPSYDGYFNRMSGMGNDRMYHEQAMHGGYGDHMSSYTSSIGRQRYDNTRGRGRYGYYDNDY